MTRARRAAATAAVAACVAAGCADPSGAPVPSAGDQTADDEPSSPSTAEPTATDASEPAADPVPDEDGAVDAAVPPDPGVDAVAASRAAVLAALDAASAAADRWDRAADAGDVPTARAAAEDVARALTADPALGGDVDGDGALREPDAVLLPGPETSRVETVDYGDALSTALAAARGAGDSGSRLLAVLQDAVAGDLGVWQRDPAGPLGEVAATVDEARATRGLPASADELVVGSLDGDALRALAWAVVAAGGSGGDGALDADALGGLHERTAAHLAVARGAVDGLDG